MFRVKYAIEAASPEAEISFTGSNAKVAVTHRLHAAIATLAYGNPAYLTLHLNRVKLVSAAGLEYKHGKRLVVDRQHLDSPKDGMISFLGKALNF